MLPADMAAGVGWAWPGPKRPPPARPRVVLVVGRAGDPLGTYLKKPFSHPPPISVEAARYPGIVKPDQRSTACERIRGP